MKILIWSFKGGVGKTTIALSLALSKKFGIISNDLYSPVEDILPTGHARILNIDESIPRIPDEYDIIYDFGGYIDKRILDVVKQVDYVILPTRKSSIDLKATINCINEIKDHVKDILVVCNFCKGKEDLEYTKKIILGYFPKLHIVPLKESRIFSHLIDKKTNIEDLVAESGLTKYIYSDVSGQFNAILKFLKLTK